MQINLFGWIVLPPIFFLLLVLGWGGYCYGIVLSPSCCCLDGLILDGSLNGNILAARVGAILDGFPSMLSRLA